jgi:hypothetical protein
MLCSLKIPSDPRCDVIFSRCQIKDCDPLNQFNFWSSWSLLKFLKGFIYMKLSFVQIMTMTCNYPRWLNYKNIELQYSAIEGCEVIYWWVLWEFLQKENMLLNWITENRISSAAYCNQIMSTMGLLMVEQGGALKFLPSTEKVHTSSIHFFEILTLWQQCKRMLSRMRLRWFL